MCQQLYTCHVWVRHKEWEQALSLLPILLLLSCLISGLCKISPPAPLQHAASIFTFQFLFILTFFLPLSLLSSSCIPGVSLGKTLNLKGLLNNLAQPCTQEIKPFCTFSVYHCVLQSKVLLHTRSLQPFGDWLHHLREVQVEFSFLCVNSLPKDVGNSSYMEYKQL